VLIVSLAVGVTVCVDLVNKMVGHESFFWSGPLSLAGALGIGLAVGAVAFVGAFVVLGLLALALTWLTPNKRD
jgi:hypothetical protein